MSHLLYFVIQLAHSTPFPHQEKIVPPTRREITKGGQFPSPDVTVYGYHPYWGGSVLDVDLSPLSHVAVFNVDMDSNGDLSGTDNWTSVAAALVEKAHASGVKVHLCLTSFSDGVNNTVLPDANRRANAINQLANLVNSYGADGVNVDIEGMDASQRNNLNLFTAELAAVVPEVTLATPAIDWSNAYDYATLASLSDGLFIMGYGYHWSGGDPGPVDPLYGGSPWGTYSLEWTVNDYLSKGVPKEKIIMGLPLYGREWPTSSSQVPGNATGTGVAVVFSDAGLEASQSGSLFDAVTRTPYVLYPSSQLWYGDVESVQERIRFANGKSLQGIGFWALSYEVGLTGFWEMVNSETVFDSTDEPDVSDSGTFSDSGGTQTDPDVTTPNSAPIADAGRDANTTTGSNYTLSASASFDPEGDPLQFYWRQLTGPTTKIRDQNTATPDLTFNESGLHTFELSVFDGELYAEPDTVDVTVIETSKDSSSCQSFPLWVSIWLAPLCLLRRPKYHVKRHTLSKLPKTHLKS